MKQKRVKAAECLCKNRKTLKRADGSKSEEYCFHCFQGGRFLGQGISLQEKIEKNVKFAVQTGTAEDQARKPASSVLPGLKRWKN